MSPHIPILFILRAACLCLLGLFSLYLTSCTKHPKPSGPAFEKVNVVPTANDDVGRGRSELYLAKSPAFPVVYFDFDSDRISDTRADALSNMVIEAGGTWTCQIDGYASEEGTEAYNLALGARRAASVSAYLASFPGFTLQSTSYGEERPAATRELSRRVEIRCK